MSRAESSGELDVLERRINAALQGAENSTL
jgi:hypothetical protein